VSATHLAPNAVGIGWRQAHYQSLLEQRPSLGFIEVHAENFFAEGGAALAVLEDGRAAYALSLHGVGLGLGSAAGLDGWHVERLAGLVERFEPARVSDHACFARVGSGHHASDLLPIPFNEAMLALMVKHVNQVQQRLRRPLLVENISSYLAWDSDTLAEPQFFNELCRRSGCGLLLDLNNLMVNGRNRGESAAAAAQSARAWVAALCPGIVGEIHLAGHCDLGHVVIDDHGSRVSAELWQLYQHTLELLGPVPTLIEWDTEVPELNVLLSEVALARQHQPSRETGAFG
jgi:uncharacterized protein (UPF0276 family)